MHNSKNYTVNDPLGWEDTNGHVVYDQYEAFAEQLSRDDLSLLHMNNQEEAWLIVWRLLDTHPSQSACQSVW